MAPYAWYVLPVPVGPAISSDGPSAMPGPLGPGRPARAISSAQAVTWRWSARARR